MRVPILIAAVVLAASPALAGKSAKITGDYVEARTAEVFAGGCIMSSEAETIGRQAVLAWRIRSGEFNDVTLDGLSVMAAVSGDRNLGIREIGGDGTSVGQGVGHRGRARHDRAAGRARRLREGRVWRAHRRGRRGETGANPVRRQPRTRSRCREPTPGSPCSGTCTTTRAAARCSGSIRSPPGPRPRWASPMPTASRGSARHEVESSEQALRLRGHLLVLTAHAAPQARQMRTCPYAERTSAPRKHARGAHLLLFCLVRRLATRGRTGSGGNEGSGRRSRRSSASLSVRSCSPTPRS